MCVYICINIYMCVCVCIYIYVYIFAVMVRRIFVQVKLLLSCNAPTHKLSLSKIQVTIYVCMPICIYIYMDKYIGIYRYRSIDICGGDGAVHFCASEIVAELQRAYESLEDSGGFIRMYISMYIYIYVCMYVCICISIYLSTYLFIYLFI